MLQTARLSRWPVGIVLLSMAITVQGQTPLYVSPGSAGTGLSPQSPTNFQSALDYARSDGAANTIYLSAGVYDASTATYLLDSSQHDNQNIAIWGGFTSDFITKTDDPSLTQIDGGTSRQILLVRGQQGLNYTLAIENLSFTNGYDGTMGGAAAALISGVPNNWGPIEVRFRQVHFINNKAGEVSNRRSGGAILASLPVTFESCHFYGNTAGTGGVAYLSTYPDGSKPNYLIDNCVFDSNVVYQWTGHILFNRGNMELRNSHLMGAGMSHQQPGSAIANHTNSEAFIHHNTFEKMASLHWGTAIDIWDGNAVIVNNTFKQITMGFSGSGYGTITYFHDNNTTARKIYVTNNSFYDVGYAKISSANALVFRGNAQDTLWVYNNIAYNPPGGMGDTYMFYNMDNYSGGVMILGNNLSSGILPLNITATINAGGNLENSNPLFVATDDLHLQASSPAIDAGTTSAPYLPDRDLQGTVRHLNTAPDMGAYEYNRAPTSLQLDNNNLDENVTIGTLVGRFSTTDPDAGDQYCYTLVAHNGMGMHNTYFTIFADSLVTNQLLDFESNPSLDIQVKTEDSGGDSVVQIFTITVNDINEPGYVAHPIPDQLIRVNVAWNFVVPANTFADPDHNDQLATTSFLADGNALPTWLDYSPASMTYNGTPSQAGGWEIVLQAIDNGQHVVADTFRLTVETGIGITQIDTPTFTLYPNPVDQYFWVSGPFQYPATIVVYNLPGQIMTSLHLTGIEPSIGINCSQWPAGQYLLELRQVDRSFTGTIIKP